MKFKTQYIPDLVGLEVAEVSDAFASLPNDPFDVYYEFGHKEEIERNLAYKEGNPNRPKKYPLVWFVTPFEESYSNHQYYVTLTELRLLLIYDTEPNYTMAERRDNVFKPILYPLLEGLIKRFAKSNRFSWVPKFKKTDIQLARVNANENLLSNDFVDIIDVTFQNVHVNNIC